VLCPVVVAILKTVNIARDYSCIIWVQSKCNLKKRRSFLFIPLGTHVWLCLEVVDIDTKTLVFRAS
jgi:hypothetical protein